MVDNKGAIVLFADRKSVPGSNVVSACVSYLMKHRRHLKSYVRRQARRCQA